jgi:hypothetical protein
MAVRVTPNQTLIETFSRGIVRDLSPALIPAGGVYDASDFLFDRAGLVYKRGGSTEHSLACGSATRGVTIAILEPPNRILLVCEDENIYDVTSEHVAEATLLGSVGFTTSENPPLYVGRLVYTDDDAQYSTLGVPPKKVYFDYPDLFLVDLGGSPPVAFRSCVHLDRILLARNFDNPNRIWFSGYPDPEATWDTTDAWFDVSHEITGMASFQGVLFVFGSHAIERILGDIPPGANVTNDNLILQPHAHIGCSDARSIVVTDQGVVFANADGVFITSSGGVQSLSEREDGTGISGYWRSLFSDEDPRGIACGKLNRDYLKVDVFTPSLGTPTLIAGLLYHFPTGAWTRITNILGTSYASGNSRNNTPYAELYAALGDAPKSVRLSTLLLPSAATKNDSDGAAVTPFLRTRPLGDGPGLKAYGDASLSYDLEDAASDNPTLQVTVDRGLLRASTKTPAESPLAETTDLHRKGFTVGVDSNAVAVEFQQANASARTELYWLELDVRPYDTGSQGQ